MYSDERNSVPHIIPYNRRVSFFLCGKECARLGDRVAQNGQCEYNSPVRLCGEPVCLWLPEQYKRPETSTYVQGVEVAEDYNGVIPEGFDVITLDEADYLMFQGEPFDEEDYCNAIFAVQNAMNRYDPTVIGCCWDDLSPRIQLEPRGERGYIEMRAVHKERGAQK